MIKSLAGKSRDLGNTYYKSKMERNTARYLKWLKSNGHIKDWSYEKKIFDFIEWKHRGVTSYKPDFEITENNGKIKYYEVKGFMDDKSQVKLNCMARYYPTVIIIVIDYQQYKKIKECKKLIPCWEN